MHVVHFRHFILDFLKVLKQMLQSITKILKMWVLSILAINKNYSIIIDLQLSVCKMTINDIIAKLSDDK